MYRHWIAFHISAMQGACTVVTSTSTSTKYYISAASRPDFCPRAIVRTPLFTYKHTRVAHTHTPKKAENATRDFEMNPRNLLSCGNAIMSLCSRVYSYTYSTGWPKKVSHYQKSSINRIKNRQCGYISHSF